MNHTGHHYLDLIAQHSVPHNHLARICVDLVYNHVRFSPDGLIAATMQATASAVELVGGAGNEEFSWSE